MRLLVKNIPDTPGGSSRRGVAIPLIIRSPEVCLIGLPPHEALREIVAVPEVLCKYQEEALQLQPKSFGADCLTSRLLQEHRQNYFLRPA